MKQALKNINDWYFFFINNKIYAMHISCYKYRPALLSSCHCNSLHSKQRTIASSPYFHLTTNIQQWLCHNWLNHYLFNTTTLLIAHVLYLVVFLLETMVVQLKWRNIFLLKPWRMLLQLNENRMRDSRFASCSSAVLFFH